MLILAAIPGGSQFDAGPFVRASLQMRSWRFACDVRCWPEGHG